MYSASTALLEALGEAGVSYIFANFGSDHPALVEAIAEAHAHGRKIPTIVTSPYEMVAMTCAQGYAQVTGQAQAVVVHVDCGTQSLAGAVHNAARGRAPVFVFAGLSPFTQDGEHRGSRNEFIHWIQDTHDQRGIVREYMKYDNEFRSAKNVKPIVHRAMQIAHTDPKGPVYLVGAREVMEQESETLAIDMGQWTPVTAIPLPADGVAVLVDKLATAKHPLIITTYVGRKPEAAVELAKFCERLGVGVLKSVPTAMNFPHDNAMYQGNHWNHPFQNEALAAADVVLVIDSDVPWIPTVNKPAADAAIYHIDVDPLKESMPLWYLKARKSFQADAATALKQMNAHLDAVKPDAAAVKARRDFWSARHQARAEKLAKLEAKPTDGVITPEYLTAVVRRAIDADNTIVMSEGITNYHVIADHIAKTKPGTMFASGGGSLGWIGGAAIGAKLAAPEKDVVALSGDGCYMFSIPSTVHWMARQYKTPFLQIVYNNRGWKAPKFSTLAVHPDGYASKANEIGVSFDPPPDYSQIAAASGGAYARKVERVEDVEAAVAEGLRIVREEKRCAVLDVWLEHL